MQLLVNTLGYMLTDEQVTEILKFLFWGLRKQVQLSRLPSSTLEVRNSPNTPLFGCAGATSNILNGQKRQLAGSVGQAEG